MAQRRVTARRREALVDDLRRACSEGELRPGDMLPTMRELQEKYGLSPRTVSIELKKLVAEGLLRTVPRVGIFVAHPAAAESAVYLMLTPPTDAPEAVPHSVRVRRGFEDRITELGASSLCLSMDTARACADEGTLPDVVGVVAASSSPEVDPGAIVSAPVPTVRITTVPAEGGADTVHMDNVDGGRKATMHLIRHGHERVAFLGLHPSSGTTNYRWSELRAVGWQEVMERFGHPMQNMVFQPADAPAGYDDEVRVAAQAARSIVTRRDISAVVCANDHAVLGLVEVLRGADVPPAAWPSVVGFDGLTEVRNNVLTSIRLPWEEIGRRCAQVLWERVNGVATGPGRHHELPMTLVSRMGTRPAHWGGVTVGVVLDHS